MLRIIVCLLGAILLLATLTGVGTMVQESRDAVSLEKTAQTIDIMRRVLARSISRELNELYASEDEGQEDEKKSKTVSVGGGGSGVVSFAPRSRGVGWATSSTSPFIYSSVSGYLSLNYSTSNTRGFRIPGQGVIFTLDVSVPAKPVETTDEVEEEKADADDDWEQASNEASGRSSNAYTIYTEALVGLSGEKLKQTILVIEPEAVDAVINAVVKSVASHGLKIKGLDDDDSIVVAMQLEGNRIIGSSGETNRLIFTSTSSGSARQRVIIEIDCSVLGRYADGKIDLDAVRSRAKITSY